MIKTLLQMMFLLTCMYCSVVLIIVAVGTMSLGDWVLLPLVLIILVEGIAVFMVGSCCVHSGW